MRVSVILSLITACAPPLRPADPPPSPSPPVTEIGFDVEISPPAEVGGGSTATLPRRVLAQPPEIKLRLGHYRNLARGIGLTIDRTSELSHGFRVAKLRYDGTDELIVLDPQPGPARRIDYYERHRLVLQVHEDGRAAVFIYGPPGKADGPIELERDGDADPL